MYTLISGLKTGSSLLQGLGFRVDTGVVMVHVCILSLVPRPPRTICCLQYESAFRTASNKSCAWRPGNEAMYMYTGTCVGEQECCRVHASSISSLIHYRTLMQSSQRKWRPWFHCEQATYARWLEERNWRPSQYT